MNEPGDGRYPSGDAAIEGLRERYLKAADDASKFTLGMELGQRLANHGAYEQAIEVVEQVRPLAAAEDDQILVLQRLGQAHLRLSQYQKAYLFLGEALTKLSARPSSLDLFQVYYDIAWMFFRQGYLDNARSYADGARMVLEGLDQDLEIGRQRAELLHISALVEAAAGNHEQAASCLREEAAHHQQAGDDHRLAAVYNKLSSVTYTSGDIVQALQHQEQTHRLSQKIGDSFRLALSHKNYGDIHFILGDYGTSLDHYQRSEDLCRSIGNGLGRVFARAAIGRIACAQGELVPAKSYLDQALDLARELGNRDREAGVLVDMAEWHCLQSRPEAALGCLRLSQEIEGERGQEPSPRLQVVRARAFMLQEGIAGAIEAGRVLDGILLAPLRIDDEEMTAIPELEAEARCLLADSFLRQGLRDRAAEALRQAESFIDSMAAPLSPEQRATFLAKEGQVRLRRLKEKLG